MASPGRGMSRWLFPAGWRRTAGPPGASNCVSMLLGRARRRPVPRSGDNRCRDISRRSSCTCTWRARSGPRRCWRSPGATTSRCPPTRVEGLAGLYEFRDFDHFIETWAITTSALRTERDFRQVVVDYAAEAASHGAVYLEGIFTPAEAVGRGASWDEVFTGFCDGAQEASERHGVQVRLTPDIPRGYPHGGGRADRAARRRLPRPRRRRARPGRARGPVPARALRRGVRAGPRRRPRPPSRTPGRWPGPTRSAAR